MIMNRTEHYTGRLKSCGWADAEALRIVKAFLKDFGEAELKEFVETTEKELKNVGILQPEPHCCACGGLCNKGCCKSP